jgi:putative ABC transport system permease protein
VAIAAVSAVTGQLAWSGVPASSVALSILAAVVVGVLAAAARLFRLLRPGAAERRGSVRGWAPTWRRAGLDFACLGVGLAILAINVVSGGLQPSPVEGSVVALSFFFLLAPIFIWLGLTLLAVRLLLARSARWSRPAGPGAVGTWWAANLRWLARRPARAGVAIVIGALAIAFGTEVIAFVGTYRDAKQADNMTAFGSDLRLIPGDPRYRLPSSLGAKVIATTPVRSVPARSGTDRKTIMAVEPRTYSQATTIAPRISSGAGIEALAKQRGGVLVSQEIARDAAVRPGDPLPLTIFPDDQDLSRNITLRVLGVYRSVPPSNPPTEMVISSAALPAYLRPRPDFYLARIAPGTSPGAAAAALRHTPLSHRFGIVPIGPQSFLGIRNLTTLNLGPLSEIEAVAAALIAAVAVAVLGAFLVLERRREFATLQAIGADTASILTGPALEGLVTVLAAVAIGVPVGLGLGLLSVRILGLFFTLTPPLLTVPLPALSGFLAFVVAASALALGWTLLAARRVRAGDVLREP